MSNIEPKKKLLGSWRAVHAAVWLIGLAMLAIFDWWWPGILVLVAISGLLEANLRRNIPQSFEVVPQSAPESQADIKSDPAPQVPVASQANVSPAVQGHRLEFLPSVCPSCNGPIRGHEVKWTGPQSADCPYCGSNLPMSKP